MKTNPLKDGTLSANTAGLGTVTPAMVRARAAELAVINGRSAQKVSKTDRDQARRELMGDEITEMKQAILEPASEAERWDPVPGSTGHKVPAAPSDDEDADGRSDNERLVAEGVAAAEHDQRLQAAALNRDAPDKYEA